MPLGPIGVTLTVDGAERLATSLRVDETTSIDLSSIGEATLSSTHELNVFAHVGEGGATYVLPNTPEPSDKRGQAWSVPLPAGQSALHLLSETANQIHITVDGLKAAAQDQSEPRPGVDVVAFNERSLPRACLPAART